MNSSFPVQELITRMTNLLSVGLEEVTTFRNCTLQIVHWILYTEYRTRYT